MKNDNSELIKNGSKLVENRTLEKVGLELKKAYENLLEKFQNKVAYHAAQMASCNIKGGNNLQMWGRKNDYDVLMRALKNGEITRDDLLETGSRVYDTIEFLTQK